MSPTLNLLLSLFLNTTVVWCIVHFFYYPKSRRRDYYFTYLLLSVSIFMLIYLLLGNVSADIGMGAALGLFAIFGIIRYRTESVPIREMTYLFLLVALSVLNGKLGESALTSSAPALEAWSTVLTVNGVFLLSIAISEKMLPSTQGCKYVRYDNIELIRPDRKEDLIADLTQRLGIEISDVEVGAVDFLQDVTMLKVFYNDSNGHIKSVDREFKIPQP
ncbi:DUF4956 domain-containing protein [Alloprevotella sp. OH1205_COT-284]|uniref:DUF4956 domain-containing protein n=1 Tax=Alloprevotella sp. OH1205_COT-284 TaxID=2491043 RepID=UPI000F5E6715|nr:DUF4956 domain-containing protein [Alloprevotella sp. OH1205_COT-284]RRD79953.1 DUF4956 domain-containing protein [Alloprevotella sp. OH1205_COT-284]